MASTVPETKSPASATVAPEHRKLNSSGLTIAASFRLETKTLVFQVIGPIHLRNSIRWWRVGTVPLCRSIIEQVEGKDDILHASPVLDPQSNGHFNASVVTINITAYSGSLWTQPIDVNKIGIPCEWMHLMPGAEPTDISPVLVTDSCDGWVPIHDHYLHQLLLPPT